MPKQWLGFVVSNATEKMEIAICNDPDPDLNNIVKVRTTFNGAWSPWRRIDTKRKGNKDNGDLDETVFQAENANKAKVADKLSSSVKIFLRGEVIGEFAFDGSQREVTCNVTGVQKLIDDAIAAHVKKYHTSPGSDNR